MNDNKSPGYVVVEGPIGVGKTNLAKRLSSSFSSELVLEQPENNPFLDKFYRNKGKNALATQLYYLFQRRNQMDSMGQADLFDDPLVTDFLFAKDRLFAEVTLDQHELDLYEQVCSHLTLDVPVPDLVVYLQAPVEVLQLRILARNRPGETYIGKDYLASLSEAYTKYFHRYNESPLLIVNAASIDLLEKGEDYNALLQQICNTGSGKRYFNPYISPE